MQHYFLLSRKSLRFLGSAMGIAIANRKNRCDFGALSLWLTLQYKGSSARCPGSSLRDPKTSQRIPVCWLCLKNPLLRCLSLNLSLPPPSIVGLPRKQKIGVKKLWVRESEIGEECRRFRAWIFFLRGGRKNAEKIGHQNSLRNSLAIFRKFAKPKN